MPPISLQFLDWRSVGDCDDPRYYVKGAEMDCAYVPGTLCRFEICSVRTIAADGSLDCLYRIRDAATVSDADVKAGKRPAVVFEGATLEACEDWLNHNFQ